MINATKEEIEAMGRARPGFVAAIIALSRAEGETFIISEKAFAEAKNAAPIVKRQSRLISQRSSPLEEPTVSELAANFAGSVLRWGAAGFPVASTELYTERAKICEACEHWNPTARLGLGKCAAPKCGCTSLKRWLSTEKCPLGKWPPLV